MLLENPSAYVVFAQSTSPALEFLRSVAAHTGRALLLDVTNTEVSATHKGHDLRTHLACHLAHASETHLAGAAEAQDDPAPVSFMAGPFS
ncbi:DUF692 family protein [Aquabacter sp. L1I39]|uniref:multinuclear nonheme iron-dependent oxidase n=1 Tax=Aquabacter sp. L1I39 TaxID=2820278 RepID=UPI001ADAEFFB|nr:DUF692 family multinuclear iron-containing protein [Aquabacter sp. L1I39]QTL04749.1 DUF692 family protein [Aquabacter sp. L1I39]